MQCADCKKWLCLKVTDYENGERIVNLKAPDGKGHCEHLKIETDADFGCKFFEEGHDHIEIMAKKSGSPWHHSHYEACPDCKGTGRISEGMCGRCACTGRVLFYDDGYIGEEKTRRHPNEGTVGPPPALACPSCTQHIDKAWKACPFCGVKLVSGEQGSVRVSEFVL